MKQTKNKTRWDTEAAGSTEPIYIARDNMPEWCEFDEDGALTNGDLKKVIFEFEQVEN